MGRNDSLRLRRHAPTRRRCKDAGMPPYGRCEDATFERTPDTTSSGRGAVLRLLPMFRAMVLFSP